MNLELKNLKRMKFKKNAKNARQSITLNFIYLFFVYVMKMVKGILIYY